MIFYILNRNKKIKELRKNSNFTAKELAIILKIETHEILNIDELKLKNVHKDTKEKLIPIFRGDRYDNVPW